MKLCSNKSELFELEISPNQSERRVTPRVGKPHRAKTRRNKLGALRYTSKRYAGMRYSGMRFTSISTPSVFRRFLFRGSIPTRNVNRRGPLLPALQFSALVLTLCLLLPCSAQLWAEDFRVNDDYTGAYQGYSHIATDLDGNFVVSWYDKRAGQNDIFVQFFDHVGNRLGSNQIVNDDAAGAEQLKPSLMRSQSGETYVAWQDYRITGYPFNGDIYLQKFDATNNPSDVNQRVNSDFGTGTQAWQDIAVADNGMFVVVWEDNRNGGYDVYFQRYNSDGSKAGNNIRINDDTGNAYQHNPKVAIAADGRFIVTWYDNRSGSDNIMAQRYSATGAPQGINFLVNSIVTGNKCVFPDIACDANGNFTIVWIDYRNGSYPDNPDLYGRRYSASGTALGAEFKINSDGGQKAQAEVTIGMDYAGNFITAWRDDRDGDFDIYAQYYNQSGVKVGGNYKVNSDDGSATQSFPNVTMDGINIYYTWTDDRNGNFDVYATITGYGEPALVLTPNTLTFYGEAGSDPPLPQKVQVRNIGYGILSWNASETANWLTVSPASGAAPDSFEVSASPAGLSGGEYTAYVIVSDNTGTASDSIEVSFEVIQPLSSFCGDAQQLGVVARIDGQSTTASIAIDNCGDAALNWSVMSAPEWLSVDSGTGTDGDSLSVSLAAVQAEGGYLDTLWLAAANCDNSPHPIEVAALVHPFDSLWLEPANLLRGASTEIPLHLTNYIPTRQIDLSFSCQPGMLSLDSLEIVSSQGEFSFYYNSPLSDTLNAQIDATTATILSGDDVLALLHVTALDSAFEGEHTVMLDATIEDTLGFVTSLSGSAGTVEVSSQTDVRPVTAAGLPTQPFLQQNYPNPFNLSTEIVYGIERGSYVSLDVYNLLGMRVKNLQHGYQGIGTYRASWDGSDDRGSEVASGIYFIRMTSESDSFVVKAILLK